MVKALDLTGQKFGKLTPLSVISERSSAGRMYRFWLCICDCGKEHKAKTEALRHGEVTSCGCARKDAAERRSFSGLVQTPEYKLLSQLKKRCNPKCNASKNYGKRGISVCERWSERGIRGIQNFLEDMGPRPSPNHTIERKDVDGNYCKENCIWTDDLGLQAFNQRVNKDTKTGIPGVTYNGYGYRVRISKDGVRHNVGFTKSLVLAAQMRKEAELKYYGFNLKWEMPNEDIE